MMLPLLAISIIMYALLIPYGDVVIEHGEHFMRCTLEPFYDENVKPITEGIIGPFFNNFICWWNSVVMFPYLGTRDVIYPTLRDCGFVPTILRLGEFFKVVGKDVLIDYVSTRKFLNSDLDFTRICAAWQTFWIQWQSVLTCGCNDLAVALTKLPAIPSFFASDQIRDDQTWCFISNTFNGFMRFWQEIFDLVVQIVYYFTSQGNLNRPTFRRAFDAWCDAVTCFFKSWENAMQAMWDAFVSYEFVWKDTLCIFDVLSCIVLRAINLFIKLLINGDKVIRHFVTGNDEFWVTTVKEDFREIINLLAPAAKFAPITQTLPDASVLTITQYHLNTTEATASNNIPNPIFGKQTAADCMCILVTRVMCDPLNDGTTCAQRYAATLFETFDFCCFATNFFRLISDVSSSFFEITLHMQGATEFIVYLDKQPFTTFFKNDINGMAECLYGVFRVIDVYGGCIQTVLAELTVFVTCSVELGFRIFIGILTLPYYEIVLPDMCNFLTCPDNQALNMALAFIDRLVAETPDSLLNCLCFLLNSGFPVAPAGCTGGCVVGGFVNTTAKRYGYHSRINTFRNYATSGTQTTIKDVGVLLDAKLDNVALNERLVTSPSTPSIVCDPLPACFDLCCFPRSIIVLVARTMTVTVRSFGAAFQSRNGTGSGYFSGTDCATAPCLQNDLTELIVSAVAPLKCICNLITLVIPSNGFPDPCCFFTLLGEGISCVFQVMLNVITSATSDPNFTYIKEPSGFLADFDIILKILEDTFECLCDFIRVIFSVVTDTNDLIKNYDPCCIPQKLFRALIETIRMLVQILVSLATLESPTSECYFYIRSATRPTCVPALTDLPILVQFDKIRKVLLAPPPQVIVGQCSAQADQSFRDLDKEGIASCVCVLIDAIMAQVFKPNPNSTDPPGCPMDMCCSVYAGVAFVDEILLFGSRAVASLWQNWEPRTSSVQGHVFGPYPIPVVFIEFFFCDEYQGNPLGGPLGDGHIVNPSAVGCGKVEPILQAWNRFLVGCLCSNGRGLGDMIDNFLQWFLAYVSSESVFPMTILWPRCLCSGGYDGAGVLRPFGNMVIVAARQIIILVRNLNNPSYWAPAGGSLTNSAYADGLSDNLSDIDKTWIARFLTPFANSACQFVTNLGCFMLMILGTTCASSRYNVLSSLVAYVIRAIIYLFAVVEGFAKTIAQELPGQCVGNAADVNGADGYGQASTGAGPQDACAPTGSVIAILNRGSIEANGIGRILVALLTFVSDALFGVARYGCTTICPQEDYVFTQIPHDPVHPAAPACACYQHTPYAEGKSTTICNFDVCASLGQPANEICPGNTSFCSHDIACGEPQTGPGGVGFIWCARNTITGPWTPNERGVEFFKQCPGGCQDMVEEKKILDPSQNSWAQNPATAPYYFTLQQKYIDMTVGVYPYCSIVANLNAPPSVIEKAKKDFGPSLLAYNNINLPGDYNKDICKRSECIANGWCKNDQMVSCSPGDARGILDGIVMSGLKYLRCVLNLVFNDLGNLIDPLIGIVSVFWQLSGGIIRFVVYAFVLVLKIVTSPWWDIWRIIIPATLEMLIFFWNIFQQPVILGAKFVRYVTNTTYENPMVQEETLKYNLMFKELFGTNLDGCIDDPIPCFCTHMNLTDICETDIGSLTLIQVTTLMAEHFGGITECDSLVHHGDVEYPALWSSVPYAERFLYIDCVTKRVQGEKYHKYTDMFPVDFFYSQDGWYKLFSNVIDSAAQNFARVSRAEKQLMKRTQGGTNFTRFYRNLHTRALIVENKLYAKDNIPRDSPAISLIVNMDSIWHKYGQGYYHYLGRKAFANIKKGEYGLGTYEDALFGLREATSEITSAFRVMTKHIPHIKYTFSFGMKRLGDVLFGSEPLNSPHKNTVISEPAYILNPKFNLGFKKMNSSLLIRNQTRKVKLRYDTLAWRQEPKWTEEKLRNYNAVKRLVYNAIHRVWPEHTKRDVYDKFIVGGNCRLVDGLVDKASYLVNYCLNDFKENFPTERMEYVQRYPTSKPRLQYKKAKPRRPRFERRTWRRANVSPNAPPEDWNLWDWFVCRIEDLTGGTYAQDIAEWIEDFTAWMVNAVTDPAQLPDVGLMYWLRFPFYCNHPQNIDCSSGIGLEKAAIQVTVVYLLIFIVAYLTLPVLATAPLFFGGLLTWGLVVLAVGLHYSPACFIMWPSFPLLAETSLPLLGTPVSAFAMSECLWDEINGIATKYITNDYSFIINASLVNGPVAPMCPEMIDFINCKDVGPSGDIQTILYWFYRWFGDSFSKLMIKLSGTVLGRIIPGLEEYMRAVLGTFKNASPSVMVQQEFCAYYTLPTLSFVVALSIPVILFFTMVVPSIIQFFTGLWLMFMASIHVAYLTGEGEETNYDYVRGEGGEDEENFVGDWLYQNFIAY